MLSNIWAWVVGITGGCLGFLHTSREGSLISLNIHVRRLGSFFGVQNLNFNIFRGFQKNEYFFGYEDFVDIFWVITKLDCI